MSNVDLKLVQQLRERTGAGLMDCKKALTQTNGDMEAALDILRQKGAAIAQKRADNTTGEGIVHSYIHAGGRVGVLIEINCETDFVARTDDIKNFANDVAMHIAAFNPQAVSPEELNAEFVEKEKAIIIEQLKAEGKPEAMIEKILEGKMQRVYAASCLLAQPFVKDDSVTVEELLKSLIGKLGENIKIRRFVRFEIGA